MILCIKMEISRNVFFIIALVFTFIIQLSLWLPSNTEPLPSALELVPFDAPLALGWCWRLGFGSWGHVVLQSLHYTAVTVFLGVVERSEVVHVLHVRIGSFVEKNPNKRLVTKPGSQVQGRQPAYVCWVDARTAAQQYIEIGHDGELACRQKGLNT